MLFCYFASVFGITFPFTEWLVTGLNFTSVLSNVCTESDFFTWVPTGKLGYEQVMSYDTPYHDQMDAQMIVVYWERESCISAKIPLGTAAMQILAMIASSAELPVRV